MSYSGTKCADAVISWAHYPAVVYDYDRANAFYNQVVGGVDEEEIRFVDGVKWSVTSANLQNWGTAKNRCAFLGSVCKGVVALSAGTFQLVSHFGARSKGYQKAFQKVQMGVYIRDDRTGKYLGLREAKNIDSFKVIGVDKKDAAPFFSSYSNLISFEHPKSRLGGSQLVALTGEVKDLKGGDVWSLERCHLYNPDSRKALDLKKTTYGKRVKYNGYTVSSALIDTSSSTQKFDIGLSGSWSLTSSHLGQALDGDRIFKVDGSNKLRWNARQIMDSSGKVIQFQQPNVFSEEDFDFEKTDNKVVPQDCAIKRTTKDGDVKYFGLDRKTVTLGDIPVTRWSFEYVNL